jgi:carboxymethylenebutenolidase
VAVVHEIAVPLPDGGSLPAALALPDAIASGAARAARAAVVVVHEAIGLNDDIRRIARRFADAGYPTLAPDFLAGLGPKPICIARFARGIGQVRTGVPYRRLAAAQAWLGAHPAVGGRPIGVAGVCPVVASYGGRAAIFGRNGDRLEAALETLGVEHDVKTYPEAGHAFMSPHDGWIGRIGPLLPTRNRYDPAAAEDAWSRTLAFFSTHLQPAPGDA